MDRADTARTVGLAGLGMAAGALVQSGCGIAQLVDPLVSGQQGFGVRSTVVAIGQLLLLVGVAGLWRSGAAGDGQLGRAGLIAAIAAGGLLVGAELTDPFRPDIAVAMFGVAAPLLGAGMLAAGVAVARLGCWTGWRRFTPLACGLYVFVVLLPVFAISGGPNFAALTAQNLCWLALGVALWTSAAAHRPITPPVVTAPGNRRETEGTGHA